MSGARRAPGPESCCGPRQRRLSMRHRQGADCPGRRGNVPTTRLAAGESIRLTVRLAPFVRQFALEVAFMWTPPDGQARFQNRVGGSLVRYCRMSGLLMRPLLAAGPYGVREIGSKSDKRAGRPSAIYWFFRSCLVDRLPLLRSCVLLPTSPRQLLCLSLLSFRRPVRRQREPGRSPFSWSAPRPSAPSCWRAPPRPASSAYVPTSWPATDP